VAKEMNLAFEASLFTLRIDFYGCLKILRHGADGFTSPPKEIVLRVFIALKNPSGLNPLTVGPMANTLTTRSPWTTSVYNTLPFIYVIAQVPRHNKLSN
jgi:hypothetical protein